jgi:hypothetical protein
MILPSKFKCKNIGFLQDFSKIFFLLINLMKVLTVIATILFVIKAKLFQVVSFTRHGARYHVNDFGDGNDTKPLWGELTSVGMRQHQRLGQLLRK